MSVSRKYGVKYSLSTPIKVAIAILIGSGAILTITSYQSKASQCYRLISAVNQGNSKIDQNKGKQAATAYQLARELDEVSQNLATVYLGDTKLKEFQSSFTNVFQSMSQSIGNAAKALDSAKKAQLTPAGRAKVQKAKIEIEAGGKAAVKAAADADVLAGEVNQYCSQ